MEKFLTSYCECSSGELTQKITSQIKRISQKAKMMKEYKVYNWFNLHILPAVEKRLLMES